jgi:hypothetical protein
MRITDLLIFIVSLGFVLPFTGSGSPAEDFRFEAAKLNDKKIWTQVNAEPYHVSSQLDVLCAAPTAAMYSEARKTRPHEGSFITVYVNNIGREAMFSKDPHFPRGSVIVKQKFGGYVEDRTKILLYTIMRKREPGYNPTVGDWEFSVVNSDGVKVEASGKLENCQSCHRERGDSDFVFRPYVTGLKTIGKTMSP